MVTLDKGRVRLAELGLEHDLRGRAAEVEDRVALRVRTRSRADSVEEVIRGDPRVHALVAPVHDDHPVLRGDRERVLGAEAAAHRVQNVGALLLAGKPEPSRRLHRDGGARAQRLGDDPQRLVEEHVQALRRVLRMARIRRQAGLGLHEHLVLVLGRRSAVVELVDVDAGAGASGVDHEGVLHQARCGCVLRLAVRGGRVVGIGLIGSGELGGGRKLAFRGGSGRRPDRLNRWQERFELNISRAGAGVANYSGVSQAL